MSFYSIVLVRVVMLCRRAFIDAVSPRADALVSHSTFHSEADIDG